MKKHLLMILAPLMALPALVALADAPKIEAVTATPSGAAWRFDVTLSHPDTGWDHYVDSWRVLDMQGNALALRVLTHPHEQEQPFTRSLSGVLVPAGTTQVQIQARCLIDGWGEDLFVVDLK